MKSLLIFIFISSLVFSQNREGPIDIVVSPEVIRKNLLRVTIKIKNKTNYPVEQLEGFITESDPEGRKISEKRVVIVGPTDPALNSGFSVTKSKKYNYNPNRFFHYTFHVGTIKFSGDYRIYTWHPLTGFIRVD